MILEGKCLPMVRHFLYRQKEWVQQGWKKQAVKDTAFNLVLVSQSGSRKTDKSTIAYAVLYCTHLQKCRCFYCGILVYENR